MQLAGMRTWQDAIGNVHGELRGVNSSASALLLGSHYDTVKDAGAFDGSMGIITAIAAVKALVATSRQCTPRTETAALAASLTRDKTHVAAWAPSSVFSFLTRMATGVPAGVATGGAENRSEKRVAQRSFRMRDLRPCVGAFLEGEGSKVNVRVVAFADEEGVRFQSTFLGSRALAGVLLTQCQLQSPSADEVLLWRLRTWVSV
jgi:hypothetical protein